MKRHFALHKLFKLLCLSGSLVLSSHAMAASFQLWEEDVTSVGTYHAGRAAIANDASVAYNNPAGIPRFKNQQMIIGDNLIVTELQYKGIMNVSTMPGLAFVNTPSTAQGGAFA